MSPDPRIPWWAAWLRAMLPDIRGWSTIGMFAMVFYVIHLMAIHPELAENELFKTVATLLLGSGAFGLVCAFLWGGSKASNAAADTVNVMAQRVAPASDSAAVTVENADSVKVTESKK